MLTAGSATLLWAAAPAPTDIAETLRVVVSHDAPPDPALPSFGAQRAMLERFYGNRSYAPAWTEDGRPTRQADEAVALLGHADEQGLASADYDATGAARALAELRATATATALEVARFDTNLTLALLRYTSHLAHGRIDPGTVFPDLEDSARRVDVVALIQRGLDNDRLTAEIESAAPELPLYARLTQALARYRRLAADAPLAPVPVPKNKVAPGARFAGLPQLKQRLVAFGDLDSSTLDRRDGTRYDGAIVEAVKRFQYRHGLAEDGVLGQTTLAELNRPPAERVRQIEVGIERVRWLPPPPTGRFLLINIPEFRLLAFDSEVAVDRPLLEMPVIVGRAGKTETPVFADEVEYLDFSPYWNVPRSIAVKEMLPKLRADPGYLARQNMEIVGNGVHTAVDAATLAELERGAARLRQRPGTRNALGGVKFMFPNHHDVYLHSTPAHQFFNRTRRDFSHGCIRVADPVALSQFVLFDRPEWDGDRARAAMSLPQPRRVNLREPIPIVIFYLTTVVDGAGRTRFLPDIYGHDEKLARALAGSPQSLH
jgi:murein L,D-transpeptidase YcbB/YkuD